MKYLELKIHWFVDNWLDMAGALEFRTSGGRILIFLFISSIFRLLYMISKAIWSVSNALSFTDKLNQSFRNCKDQRLFLIIITPVLTMADTSDDISICALGY